MALIVADRVQETSTTVGAGALTLLGATTGYRAASTVCANGDTFTYYAEDIDVSGRPLGGWETGLGTWGTGNILTRTTIYASSNANAAVSWAAGTRRIGLGLVSTAALGQVSVNGSLSLTQGGFDSKLTAANTVNRTYTLPDKDGTVAMVSDISGNPAFIETNQTVTTSYTLTAGKNAMSTGPVTINSGVTVTIPAGAIWAII
jgi:hypothetical protein